MSAALPETVDAWRMVTARRSFTGSLPLASLKRLASSLAATQGDVRFELSFDRDTLGVAYVGIQAEAPLTLMCQRTLEPFVLPVRLDSHIGLIVREEDEAGLPAGYEPLLVPGDGVINPAEVIEDELILALPVVPLKPGGVEEEFVWSSDEEDEVVEKKVSPFAALQKLKHQ